MIPFIVTVPTETSGVSSGVVAGVVLVLNKFKINSMLTFQTSSFFYYKNTKQFCLLFLLHIGHLSTSVHCEKRKSFYTGPFFYNDAFQVNDVNSSDYENKNSKTRLL